eukprot:comp20828_c0_seq1/m.27490 comp20828_c0_seq1/g.27490  ORF comp20828_c0_seq1/g.27490 comp20828_c0_seq1/m.27490 type:complete len:138 (-) comp20828_c0_seq1:933-1346(-)
MTGAIKRPAEMAEDRRCASCLECACAKKPALEHETTVSAQAYHEDKSVPHDHPRNLIPELCRLFYDHGWVTGTGGGITIRVGNEIYIAPSGVQKERIEPVELFVCDEKGNDISLPPAHKNLKKSQCTPLFFQRVYYA